MSRLNRVVVAAVLAIGVMFAGGVVEAKPKPAPRGVCTKVGQVVSAPVRLVCKQTVKNGLRWRKAPIPTTTTTSTTTTPIAPSTTVALVPSVSLAATFLDSGAFPKAAVVTTNVAGTVYFIEGASPVNTVSDITSARYYRWTSGAVTANTPTSIALDVDVLTNGYYRVFVANGQGVLSAPAFNKVTISIPRISNVAVTPTTGGPVTCAQGGSCAIGDTGPGGGKVFYVQATGTFNCGVALTSTCKYLEVAPNTWSGGSADPIKLWAVVAHQSSDIATITNDSSAYNNALGIGLGYKNSLAIVGQGNDTTTAAGAARAYGGGAKSDWYLPTTAELNLLCQWARNVAQNVATSCTGGTLNTGTGASGGFSADDYWSSSEFDGNIAWIHVFDAGNRTSNLFKNGSHGVRPVRAFGGTVACADGGVCAVGDTGPGGGIVFYVQASGGTFTSTGSDCGTTCKYLEAAPSDQSAGIMWATTAPVCYNSGSTTDTNNCQASSVYSGDSTAQAASRTAATEIGKGMANTNQIYARLTTAGGVLTSSYAAGIAYAYANSGKTDWHLPSKDELNQLFINRATVGGFSTDVYWSSSESVGDVRAAWGNRFNDGNQGYYSKYATTYDVRPVRAF